MTLTADRPTDRSSAKKLSVCHSNDGDSRIPPRRKWGLCSSELLRSACLYLTTFRHHLSVQLSRVDKRCVTSQNSEYLMLFIVINRSIARPINCFIPYCFNSSGVQMMTFVWASLLYSVECSDVPEEPTASTFRVTAVSFEAFRAVNIYTVNFWAMTPCSLDRMPTFREKNLPPKSVRTYRNSKTV